MISSPAAVDRIVGAAMGAVTGFRAPVHFPPILVSVNTRV